MAQIISVRLNKPDHQPIGFRLQGGKDFGTPLVVQKVNGGSAAERAGLLAGDAVIQVNGTDVYNLRHQDAQDTIRHAGHNLEITVQRGGGTWRPTVTPTGSLPRPGKPLGAVSPVTQTSLKAPHQPSLAFGSGHNSVAKPFNYMNGSGDSTVKSIVNKQYNTPVGMYSDETIAETLSAQTEVLAGGVLGVNFKKNEKTYDAEKSAVFKMLQEDSNDPEPESAQSPNSGPVSGLRHVTAPVTKPDAPINNTGGLPPGQNICEECERLIIGVFVRIKDKNLHVECFKCATCGTSLKNQGYYNLNGKLYCDIHAKLVARQNPPASNLEPVTIPPGSKFPSGTYTTPLSSHTTPLPPLSTNYNTNGNSLFSQSNETKSFGDSVDTPELKQQNVEAFTSLLHNGHESDNKNLSATSNGLLNISGKENSLDNSVNETSPITSAFSTNSIVNSNTNSAYRKVIPPHMGGNYKPASNLSGPKPFGSSTFSGASPSLSPRSAPISPASTLPRAAPVAPVVPPPSQTTLQFTDKKTENGLSSTNTDTLMRKMAKFALSNDYEIGIQRKIKPRDHIQNMADKIKDTVVMKHPLNTPPEYTHELNNSKLIGSPFNSRQSSPDDKTLRRQLKPSPKLMYNNFEIGVQRKIKPGDHISSMADKIKDTIVSKHPTNSFMNEYKSPSTTASSSTVSSAHSREGSLDSSDSSHSSHYLRNGKNGFSDPILPPPPPPPPTNGFKNEFKSTPTKPQTISSAKDSNKIFDYTSPYDNHKTDILKSSPLVNKVMNDLKIDNQCNEKYNEKIDNDIKKSLYSSQNYNNIMNKRNDILNGSNKEKMFESKSTTNSSSESLNDNKKSFVKKTECTDQIEDKSPVKLREKKRDTSNDENSGKRDSHVTTRPISTIASFDLVDGTYPICNQCNKQITRGPFITALGRIWCPDHFVCVNQNCRRPLQDIGFVEENGQLYCEYCFEQFIAPACDKCHAKIKGDCLNAIGKHFHPECFNCAYCGKLFGNNPFFLEDGLPYCEADWNELFTTKCFACGFPVEAGDRWVEALNNNYHSQCFNCTMCKKNLEGQSFFAKGGRPFCKNHAR